MIVDVGTDPLRHQSLGADEVAWLNSGWFGDPPLTDTEGYLAPPLLGVWATAPYLHNGSIPNLRSLIVASERPAQWCPGDGSYDEVRLGVVYATGTCFDTSVEGLSSGGHLFGSTLSEGDVSSLLAYLSTL